MMLAAVISDRVPVLHELCRKCRAVTLLPGLEQPLVERPKLSFVSLHYSPLTGSTAATFSGRVCRKGPGIILRHLGEIAQPIERRIQSCDR